MNHICHAAGCKQPVPPKLLMCRNHWKLLPKPAQHVIWRYYRPGQEIDKDASDAYLLAQACAVAVVAVLDKTWSVSKALNHVAVACRGAQIDGIPQAQIEEIARAMGCETIIR